MLAESSDSVKIGKGQHVMDSRVLSNESAVEEPFNNIIGMVLEKRAIGRGGQLHDLVVPFEQDLLQVGELGDFQKSEIFCNWSPTEISDKNWDNLFYPMPKLDTADKSHAASVFNKGIALSFERLSCHTCYAFRQHKTDNGRIERQLIRFGMSLDEIEGSQFCKRLTCDWESVPQLKKVALELGTPIENKQTPGNSLRELWDFFSAKAEKHHTADGDFFATAFMPIRTVDGKPLLTVDESGELCFLDSNCQHKQLRRFYAEAYMYKSSSLDAPVKHVHAIIQGKELDLTDTKWNKIAAEPSQVFKIYDRDGTRIGFGQCKALTDEEINEKDLKPGVRIALKNSTKFVNADPGGFFDDRMCDVRVQPGDQTLSRKVEFYKEKGMNAQKKITFGGSTFLDPLKYMDELPSSYSSVDFNTFLDEAIKISDQYGGGKHLLCQALAFKTYSIIQLDVEMLTGPQKSYFIKQPAGDFGYQYVAMGLGAIYRAITEITFPEAKEALQRMRASAPAPPLAPASPPTGPFTIVPYTASAPEPGRRGDRNRAPRQRLDMTVLGGGEDEHHSRPKKKSKVKEVREAAITRLELKLKERLEPRDYDDEFAPLINEVKALMPR